MIDQGERAPRPDADQDRIAGVQRYEQDSMGNYRCDTGRWCQWQDVQAEVTRLTEENIAKHDALDAMAAVIIELREENARLQTAREATAPPPRPNPA